MSESEPKKVVPNAEREFWVVTFRMDKEIDEALKELESAVEGGARGRKRSIAIRKAILEARDKLRILRKK